MKGWSSSPSGWQLLAGLAASVLLCAAIWIFALWSTGASLERWGVAGGGFIALRLAPQAGLSYQWSDHGQSIWAWRGELNRRLWASE